MKNLNGKLIFSALTIFCALILLNHSAIAQQPAPKGMVLQKKPPAAAVSAKFRITLNGFAVNHQSDDDILEGDGKGDEIYLRADVWRMDKNGVVSQKQMIKSAVMGDINNHPNRKQAGSASDKGGLRTGDKFPTNEPWERGALQTLELPMLLWMGTLTQGEDGVSIIPTVWEWDSPDASSSETLWDNNLDSTFSRLKPQLLNQIQNKVTTTAFDMNAALNNSNLIRSSNGRAVQNGFEFYKGKGGTRPIGIFDNDTGIHLGVEPDVSVFLMPQILPLNYDSALKATRTSPSDNGLGIFAFRYTDKQDHGDYTLYIQVEKIN